ncbi:hypothetical protein RRF57_001556 [Xylaria bambusicola]|uniref:Ankyrin n=1 Tax=Xylaria bambusicola TaxID=326684 RepID=A0AAN7U5N5_9PEZI
MFFSKIGVEESFSQARGEGGIFKLLYDISRNPSELHKAASLLAGVVPNKNAVTSQKTDTLAHEQLSSSMAKEILQFIFFRLSNKDIPRYHELELRAYDKSLLQFVELVSRSNPEIVSYIFSGHCATTNAIKEAVYGSAIRERSHAMVLRLLECGVDPDIVIASTLYIEFGIEHGMIKLVWRHYPGRCSGICAAAFVGDTHLGKILLSAGASVKCTCTKGFSPLEIVALTGGSPGASSSSVEFAKLLIKHGALNDESTSCRKCRCWKLISPIAIAVSKNNTDLAQFLIERYTNTHFEYSEVSQVACNKLKWYDSHKFGFGWTPLTIAIILVSKDLTRCLLPPVLSYPGGAPERVIKQALIVALLVGDVDTASEILTHHPDIGALRQWAEGITPLVATAWNKDTTVAEVLLGLGAHIGPQVEDGILETSTPAPIHIAAYYGNTSLIQQLIHHGASCHVRASLPLSHAYCRMFDMNLPYPVASPLEMALWNGSGDAAALLKYQNTNIFSEHSAQELDRDNDASFLSTNKRISELFEGNKSIGRTISIIQSYFSLGGLYLSEDLYSAVQVAIEWGDHSVVQLLVGHRPIGEIDGYEASALVTCIEKRARNLISILVHSSLLPGSSGSHFYFRNGALDWRPIAPSRLRCPEPGYGLTPLGASIHFSMDSTTEEMIQKGYKLQVYDMKMLERYISLKGYPALYPLECLDFDCRRRLLQWSITLRDIRNVRRYIEMIPSLDIDFHNSRLICDLTPEDVYFPLGLAVKKNSIELVRLLLAAGASIQFQGYGPTVLEIAAQNENVDMAKYLLDAGAVFEPPNRLERPTALQMAAINGNLAMAKLLISSGANINSVPSEERGCTALEWAARMGKLDMVQFLLDMGAELGGEMRIYYVRSVRFAVEEGHHSIAHLLKKYGPWSEKEQRLYDRSDAFFDALSFRYEEEVDDWIILKRFEDRYSTKDRWLTYCSLANGLDESDISDPSDNLDVETDENDDVESYNDLLGSFYDMDWIPQPCWDGLGGHDLTVTGPSSDSPTGGQSSMDGVASPQISASERVTEIDEAYTDRDPTQDVTDQNAFTQEAMNCDTANWLESWEQGNMIREEENDLNTNYVVDMDVVDEQHALPNEAELEWEGPFSDLRMIDDVNKMYGVWSGNF